jgi:hypothetical protein
MLTYADLMKTIIQRVGAPPVVVQQNAGPLKRDAKARATQSKMQVAVTSLSLLSLPSISLSLSLPPSACPLPLAFFFLKTTADVQLIIYSFILVWQKLWI